MSRWVCPNDRQLALRAQLGTGWSYYTNKEYHKTDHGSESITNDELRHIARVLARKELCDNVEKKRIGHMMLHLRNINKHSNPASPASDTTIATILSNNNSIKPSQEAIQSSSTNNKEPDNHCHICGEQVLSLLSLLPGPYKSKHYHLCNHCLKTTCEACVITTTINRSKLQTSRNNNTTHTSSNNNDTSTTSTNNNQYTKPNSKVRPTNIPLNRNMTSSNIRMNESSNNNSDIVEENNGQNKRGVLTWLLSKYSKNNSDDVQLRICRYCVETIEIWKRSGAWQFQEVPHYSLPDPTHCRHPDLCSWSMCHSIGGGDGGDGAPNGLIHQHQTSHTGAIDSASWETYKRPPPRWSTLDKENPDETDSVAEEISITNELTFERYSFNPFEKENSPDIDKSNAGLNSKASTTQGLEKPSDIYLENKEIEQIKQIPPVGSQYWSHESLNVNKKKKEDFYGILNYKVFHDSSTSQLIVTLESGENLKAMDSNGLSDPYVKCHLLPGHSHKTKLRTKTCYKTLHPVWKESLIYHGIDRADMDSKTLRLAVLDEDTIGFDWIGEYRLYLADLNSDEEYFFKHELLPRQPIAKDSEDLVDHERGKIFITLLYDNKTKTLHVAIVRCAELAPMDTNGFSDPFCKLYLKPDKLRMTKRKTQTKKMTLNPFFNEEFIIELDHPNWNKDKTLEISVWDYDRGPTNDFIGGVRFHYRAKGDRGKLWRSLIDNPNKKFEGWFILCADLRDIE